MFWSAVYALLFVSRINKVQLEEEHMILLRKIHSFSGADMSSFITREALIKVKILEDSRYVVECRGRVSVSFSGKLLLKATA